MCIFAPIYVEKELHIILLDDATLWAGGGIVVEGTNKVTITCGGTSSKFSGTGQLYAYDYYNGESSDNKNDGDDARIGSRAKYPCGYIEINGGHVTTFSTYSGSGGIGGADIGCGMYGSCGSIEINGGEVVCRGGSGCSDARTKDGFLGKRYNTMYAAVIGTGYDKKHPDDILTGTTWIRVFGGYVQVNGTGGGKTCYGAGIGAGYYSHSNVDIYIKGGTVYSVASVDGMSYGAGIGTSMQGSSVKIEIAGGNVTGISSNSKVETAYGAGIGAGNLSNPKTVEIIITGGNVTGRSGYANGDGCGIGGGSKGFNNSYGGCKSIKISGTANVQAYNCYPGYAPLRPGLGNHYEKDECEISLYGDSCSVEAYGSVAIGDEQKSAVAYYNDDSSRGLIMMSGTLYRVPTKVESRYYAAGDAIADGNYQWRKIVYKTQETTPVTIDETGFTTLYYSDRNLLLPDDIEAYTVESDNNGDMVYVPLTGPIINAGTGVVLQNGMSSAKTYYLESTSGTSWESTINNQLYGSDQSATTTNPWGAMGDGAFTYYRLTADSPGNPVFKWVNEGGKPFTSAAHEAYLYFANRGAEVSMTPIYYKDESGNVVANQFYNLVKGQSSGTYKLQGTYYVQGTTYVYAPIVVKDSLRIILLDGARLHASGGIIVEDDSKLEITSGGTGESFSDAGELIATDYYNGDGSGDNDNNGDDARIGSREGKACGHIVINGGTVRTFSTYPGGSWWDVYWLERTYLKYIFGADIGSGYQGRGGKIEINGGNVYCNGGCNKLQAKIASGYVTTDGREMNGACIGSGAYAEEGEEELSIRISGGNVTVYGTGTNTESRGAGIGTGQNASCNAKILISGGEVFAASSKDDNAYGAGIGSGVDYSGNMEIEITGGNVTGMCSEDDDGFGAGIGSGSFAKSLRRVAIYISGGHVKGVSSYNNTSYSGCGIGGGYAANHDIYGCSKIVISGTADVKAYNCDPTKSPQYPGLGSAYIDDTGKRECTIDILGDSCSVEAYGNNAISGESSCTATAYFKDPESRLLIQYGNEFRESAETKYISSSSKGVTINNGDYNWCDIMYETGSVPVTIGSTGYATLYYSDKDLYVPRKVTAYTIAYDNDSHKIKKQKLTRRIISAGTAVVLSDDENIEITYDFPIISGTDDEMPENRLLGFDEAAMTVSSQGTTDGYCFYKFSVDNNGEKPGFYWDQEDGKPFMIDGHKAYLCLSASEADNRNNLLMANIINGIASVATDSEADTRIYDLNGRFRGTDPQALPSGIYIRGKQKIVIK